MPPLRLLIAGRERGASHSTALRSTSVVYRMEAAPRLRASRRRCGAQATSASSLDADDGDGTLVASTETWETVLRADRTEALDARASGGARLLAQAHPAARDRHRAPSWCSRRTSSSSRPPAAIEEAARANAAGDEVRTVIAGYHWFTDWGRDTMISLEGLTLLTGRHAEAGYILRTFAPLRARRPDPQHVPRRRAARACTTRPTRRCGSSTPSIVTSTATGDRHTLQLLLPTLRRDRRPHIAGTRFGIGVDPADGLLRQGADGYQLTWMDAKVDDWVVTPRRGKAVEINALWYNALRLLERWLRAEQGDAAAEPLGARRANACAASFNARFWYAGGGYLYDVVDGEAGRRRRLPAQPDFRDLAAASGARCSTAGSRCSTWCARSCSRRWGCARWRPATRTTSAQYYGDLRARDAAYHQGTVWAWLIGPFVDAWLKVAPNDLPAIRELLNGFEPHLSEACVGSISEIFDAEAPFIPRGCVAQAWSVAEVLRAWVRANVDEAGEPGSESLRSARESMPTSS